ncbi:MAG: DNA alkylation repair protein [Bacteroidales bacterium]|nr:DNA alkylation repair protein [Bacteroidales bacterium]
MKRDDIIERLKGVATAEKREVQLRFFKTGEGEYGYGDNFLGVMVPQVRLIVKECVNHIDLTEIESLLHSEYHEARLTALLLLVKMYEDSMKFSIGRGRPRPYTQSYSPECLREKIFNIYISNTRYINNWDLVDLSTPNIVGNHLYNGDCSLLYEFAKSNHLWKQRIAVVSTLTFIRKGEFTHTYALAKLFMDTRHDLIQKAVGWMLREAGKRDATQLRNFLNEYKNIMPRTMLRYAIEKFSIEERKEFMGR